MLACTRAVPNERVDIWTIDSQKNRQNKWMEAVFKMANTLASICDGYGAVLNRATQASVRTAIRRACQEPAI